MAYQGTQKPTGVPKTPAPVVKQNLTRQNAGGYGRNGASDASSYPVNLLPISDLGANIKASSDDGQDLLGQVIKSGTAKSKVGYSVEVDGVNNDQLRDIAAGNVADGYGQGSARSRQHSTHANMVLEIPASLDPKDTGASPVRQPK